MYALTSSIASVGWAGQAPLIGVWNQEAVTGNEGTSPLSSDSRAFLTGLESFHLLVTFMGSFLSISLNQL